MSPSEAASETGDVPAGHHDRIVIAHGGGGELTAELIRHHLLGRLGNDRLNPLTDGAILGRCDGDLVMTTDSFVVHPLEFPGGDIGRLAVCGTVNDLAMMGAMPIGLSLALILQEGLPLALLDRIVESLAAAAREAGTTVVTGDTKVIERRGDGDGLFITTAGIGRRLDGVRLGAERVRPGDMIVLSGRIAEHGLAVMSRRTGLRFASTIVSDVAPLNGLVTQILATGADVKFMRDPTRGGLAGLLADLSQEAGWSLEVDEGRIPISRAARHAAEMFGLDPLTVANEGKVVAVVNPSDTSRVIDACRAHPYGADAAVIGTITDTHPPLAELLTWAGGRRVVQKPYGEELPRIC